MSRDGERIGMKVLRLSLSRERWGGLSGSRLLLVV